MPFKSESRGPGVRGPGGRTRRRGRRSARGGQRGVRSSAADGRPGRALRGDAGCGEAVPVLRQHPFPDRRDAAAGALARPVVRGHRRGGRCQQRYCAATVRVHLPGSWRGTRGTDESPVLPRSSRRRPGGRPSAVRRGQTTGPGVRALAARVRFELDPEIGQLSPRLFAAPLGIRTKGRRQAGALRPVSTASPRRTL